MKTPAISLVTCIAVCAAGNVFSQNTFTRIYHLLQSNCGNAGCHGGSATDRFNVKPVETVLYNNLVNAPPVNSAAAAKGDKLIEPGYPERSFLLRKIAHGISDPLVIDSAEGDYMPRGLPKLPVHEIELVRQWILHGAPLAGNVVDTVLINTYYRDGGIDDTYPQRQPPASGAGFQIYIGKIFIPPATEVEYFFKHAPRLSGDVEIPRIETMMPSGAHHFMISEFRPGQDTSYRLGLRDTSENSHLSITDGIGTASNLWSYDLPDGTAYLWKQDVVLDFNVHLRNTSPNSIMAADLYINVYTQPLGTASEYMRVRYFDHKYITIPQNENEYLFTAEAYDSSETRSWKLWKLFTHTHQYGTDYDIFLRNPDGSKGAQVYEGFFSYEQGFNTGYYRTGPDVTIRTFPDNSLLEVSPLNGFIQEAKYKNTDGPPVIYFGPSSQDEMMVMGFQYIYGKDLSTASENMVSEKPGITVTPNPARSIFSISYTLENESDVVAELYDMRGLKTTTLLDEKQTAGSYHPMFKIANVNTSPGMYFLRVSISGHSATEKIVFLK